MTRTSKILIVGAGIGGLTTAIALRQAGFSVEVFERAAVLQEAGAGIALSPNAMRVLKHLGLMESVCDRGAVIAAAVIYSSNGVRISALPTDRSDAPMVCLHRADLQQALLRALPPECIHLGDSLVNFEMTGTGVTARFSSGRGVTGDALIGADGLNSRVRAQILGDGKPVYRGYQCWRGVCAVRCTEQLTETLGPGVRVGIVPLGNRGTAWWCTANEAEFEADESAGAKAKLLRWVTDWHAPIPEVIEATEADIIIKTPMYDRPPAKTWSAGCCTLLGDAAHPTTPNMGQGGCMAIEDAVVLARCLSHHPDAATAFRAYERLRSARTAKVTKISRVYGVMGQWRNPVAVRLRNALFRLGSGKAGLKGYLKFVNYEPFEIPLNGSGT